MKFSKGPCKEDEASIPGYLHACFYEGALPALEMHDPESSMDAAACKQSLQPSWQIDVCCMQPVDCKRVSNSKNTL